VAPDSKPTTARPAVDFGKAAADYGRWRQGFPAEFFARLEALGVGLPGQRLLDLGTGTGLLARAFALRGCQVTGLDLSAELLAEARRADLATRVSIDYIQAPAEASGLAAGHFDVVSAATCWHWFDRPKAAAEVRRLLKPKGRLLIADLDWHARPGNVIDATIKAIRRHSPARASTTKNVFQYPAWAEDLTSSGFDDWESFAFTTQLSYSQEAWRGRIRASAAVGPVMDPGTLARFDEDLAATLSAEFPEEPLRVDHRVFALVAWGRD
jgi:ubiquinone/menaquinone biosynthesis C-methylase UbiE